MTKKEFEEQYESLRNKHNEKLDLFAIYDMIDLLWKRIGQLEEDNASLRKKIPSYNVGSHIG